MLARAERSYALSTPRPGWSEQDPEDWWRAADAALAEVSAGHEVAGIGLSGQMHGLVALDDADRVVWPAILWNDQRTGAECAAIELPGVPLGSFPGITYDEVVFDLHKDDVFVFYSDGISEAANGAGAEFGADRLCEVIARCRAQSPREIVDAIFEAVTSFRGFQPQSDDMTAVAVKITS